MLDEELVASSVVVATVEEVADVVATVVVLVAAGAGVAEGGELRSSTLVATAVVDVEARVTSS